MISILIPLSIGLIGSIFSNSQMQYSDFIKPDISPPAYVFPIVWTILYILMGISSYIVWNADDSKKYRAIKVYIIQLLVNGFWTLIFFNLNNYLLAFFWIILLIILVINMIIKFYQINKTSAYLQVPYLLWLIFAAYLNLSIYFLN